MNYTNYTNKKEKNKWLTREMYDKIETQYNYYNASKDKTMKKTAFMTWLAQEIGTTLSNLYYIINDGLTEVLGYDYEFHTEFSSQVAWEKRSKKSIESNSSKREKAKPFIEKVIQELKNPYNINSVDEIIHDFKLNRPEEIEGLETICTTTFYNYVDNDKIDNFDKSLLPLKFKRKSKNTAKEGKKKRDQINSIETRPQGANDRTEFGHWEGDTVVGSSKIPNSGACLTLVERMTRFQIVIKMKDRKASTVLKAFYKIKYHYPELKDYNIEDIFK